MKTMTRGIWLLILLFSTTAWGAGEREIMVKLTVPDASWAIAIEEVYTVGNELWVVSAVSRNPDMMGAQVISTVTASLKIAAPDLPAKFFVVGKTWGWKNKEPYTFIQNLKQIDKDLQSGKRIYPPAQRSTDPGLVLNKTWQWESTATPVEKIKVANPERYTIVLENDGKIQARFDCNRGGGNYEISAGKLAIGPLMSTRMACSQDSLEGPFARDLQRVTSFFFENGTLYLEMPHDSGTMKFRFMQ